MQPNRKLLKRWLPLTLAFGVTFGSMTTKADECPNIVPHIPAGLYRGPFDHFPSLAEGKSNVKEYGTYHPAADGFSAYYEIYFGTRYVAHFNRASLEVLMMKPILDDGSKGADRLKEQSYSLITIYCDVNQDTRYILELTGYSENRYCGLDILMTTSGGWQRMGIPPDSVYYTWKCFKNTAKYPEKNYQQVTEWNEVVFPDGKVYVPNPAKQPGEPGRWVPVDPKKSWLHDPELIPEEVRFTDDPMIKLVITGKKD